VGFMAMFREVDAFSKTKAFKGHKFIDLIVKQVLSWYVFNSMLKKISQHFGRMTLFQFTISVFLNKCFIEVLLLKGAM
jgi:hypothetical protein